MDSAAARLGLDPAEIRRRNLIRPDEMPYDCGTKSFGVKHRVRLRRLPRALRRAAAAPRLRRARAEQARATRRPGPRRGIGLAVYVEKTGLGPFETTHVEARPDGRFTVDTGASSMGPGLETVLAQILGDALGLAADRFDVRHADTAAVESGVGTYGSRGTVTAGNAAAMAAAKLIAEARTRAAARWSVPEAEVTYAAGVLGARAARRASPSWPPSAASPPARRSTCPSSPTRAARSRSSSTSIRRRASSHSRGRRGRRRGPRRQSRAGRRAARRRGRLRHRQHALREPRVRRATASSCRARCMDYALPLRADVPPVEASTRRCARPRTRSACAASANAATPASAPPSPMRSADALRDKGIGLRKLPLTPVVVWEAMQRA